MITQRGVPPEGRVSGWGQVEGPCGVRIVVHVEECSSQSIDPQTYSMSVASIDACQLRPLSSTCDLQFACPRGGQSPRLSMSSRVPVRGLLEIGTPSMGCWKGRTVFILQFGRDPVSAVLQWLLILLFSLHDTGAVAAAIVLYVRTGSKPTDFDLFMKSCRWRRANQ